MNFQQSKNYLLNVFNQNNFVVNFQNKLTHVVKIEVECCSNGSKISISFPGLKTKITDNKVIYDYRVDIAKNGIITALSHANIITDIFNKIVNGGMSSTDLQAKLVEIFKEGNINIEAMITQLPYFPVAPSSSLLTKVRNIHGNKVYNHRGNSFDLTIEELFYSMKWIVLQEDINYPVANNFEGRKMPFARYMEAIHITQSNSHTLEEVIARALSHSRPPRWDG